MKPFKILLVEDEKKIALSIALGLREQQYEVDIASDGILGKQMIAKAPYDLVILDINLPEINGYQLCEHIRNRNENMMVIMLTAMGGMDDKLAGFNAGADDYLVKPFDFKELLARIRALEKRSNKSALSEKVLKVENLTMHLDSREVVRDGKTISLTAKEFQLLEYLIKNKNRVLTRADIAVDVWDIDFETNTNVIDVYVNFLRKKIDRDFIPKLIHTYIGVGYVLKSKL